MSKRLVRGRPSSLAPLFLALVLAPLAWAGPDGDPSLLEASLETKIELRAGAEKASDVEDAEALRTDALKALRLASNYAFETSTDGSLVDMSSGTTQLVAANQDDTASSVQPIGFEFWLDGSPFTQFSANSNGLIRLGSTAVQNAAPYKPLGQTDRFLITAFGSDQRTHTSGRVHYRLDGSAPNRVLVVEFLNMQSNFGTGGSPDLTYQVLLYEGSSRIEFRYGSMTMSAAGAGDPNSRDPHIGFSSGSIAGTIGTVTAAQSGDPAPSFAGNVAPAVANLYTAGPITVLSSSSDGARRVFRFTPPPVPSQAVSNLGFSAVTASTMQLNWTDSPDANRYRVLRSTDGVNFTQVAEVPAGTETFMASGLASSTLYTWRVVSGTEAGFGPFAEASQSTSPPTTIVSTPTGGPWSDTATWVGGQVPGADDIARIADGATVTIDTAAVALSVEVGSGVGGPAVLVWDAGTARTLVVGQSVNIASNGVFRSASTGDVTGHLLTVGTDLINDGVLDFSTNGDTAGAGIAFVGASQNTFGGSGPTTNLRALTVNKGGIANVLNLEPANLTIRSANTDVAGFLTLTSGTLRIGGSYTVTNRVFTTPSYTIGTAAGLWLDNPNFTVAGTASGTTTVNNGLLRITQGTYNVGVSPGDGIGGTSGTFRIEGGVLNAAGRIDPQGAVTWHQSGGTVNVAVVGNTRSDFGSFELFSAASSFIMSGGTINVINRNTAAVQRDVTIGSAIANTQISGGELVFGGPGAPANTSYRVPGGFLPNTRVNPTMTLNIANTTVSLRGTSLVMDGLMVHSGTSPRFDFASPFGPMSFSGTGSIGTPTTPFAGVGVSQASAFPVTLNAPIFVNRINIFLGGGFVNSHQITLGNGGSSTTVVQLGQASLPIPAGGFDVSPNHNQGTGGQILLYANEGAQRTTGFEINPTRALARLLVDNPNGLVITGGDLTATSNAAAPNNAIVLTNGRVITGNHTLILDPPTGVITRTNGWVDGALRLSYGAPGTKSFFIGSANGYTPVTANVTAGSFPAHLTLRSVQSSAPGIFPVSQALIRHWQVAASSVASANLVFSYLDPADLPPTLNEADLRGWRLDGSSYVDVGGTVNTSANTVTINGLTQFGLFTLADASITAPPEADLSLTLLAPSVVTAGGNATYSVQVRNQTGPDAMPSATVSVDFDASLSCSWTCTASGGGSCSASGSGDIADSVALPIGAILSYSANCPVSPAASGSLAVSAEVQPTPPATDPQPSNNVASASTAVQRLTELSVTLAGDSDPVEPGGVLQYTIGVTNGGPSLAEEARLTVDFDASLDCVWTCTPRSCPGSGSGDIDLLLTLGPGDGVDLVADCAVSESAQGQLQSTATIAVGLGASDPNPGNNLATVVTDVLPFADLAITAQASAASVSNGDTLDYLITASNAGPVAVSGALLSNDFPSGVSGCSWSCTPGPGAACPSGGSGDIAINVDLASGSSLSIAASCTVDATSGTLINTSTIATPNGVTDPNLDDNLVLVETPVVEQADLELLVLSQRRYVRLGETVSISIVVTNNGPSAASGQVEAPLPPELNLGSWTCTGIGGGSCASASGLGGIATSVTLPSGASALFTLQARVAGEDANGRVIVDAAVTPDPTLVDPQPANNADQWDVAVVLFRNGFESFIEGADCAQDGACED